MRKYAVLVALLLVISACSSNRETTTTVDTTTTEQVVVPDRRHGSRTHQIWPQVWSQNGPGVKSWEYKVNCKEGSGSGMECFLSDLTSVVVTTPAGEKIELEKDFNINDFSGEVTRRWVRYGPEDGNLPEPGDYTFSYWRGSDLVYEQEVPYDSGVISYPAGVGWKRSGQDIVVDWIPPPEAASGMHYKVLIWPVVNSPDVPISQVFDWNATSGLLQDVPLLEGTSYRLNVMIGFSDGYAYSEDVFFDWPPLAAPTTPTTTTTAPTTTTAAPTTTATPTTTTALRFVELNPTLGTPCGEHMEPTIDGSTLGGDLVQGWGFVHKQPIGFAEHGCLVVSAADGYPTRSGEHALRFEVREGDCNSNENWDDCTTDRSRHELSQYWLPSTEGTYHPQYDGDEYWYGWSEYLPADVLKQGDSITFLGQFNSDNAARFYIEDFANGLGFRFNDRNYEFLGQGVLKPNDVVRDTWIDIVMHVIWSTSVDGLIEIYVNGDLAETLTGPNMDGATYTSFAFGIYNAFISDCRCEAMPTQVVYYDAVRRGRTFEEVSPSN